MRFTRHHRWHLPVIAGGGFQVLSHIDQYSNQLFALLCIHDDCIAGRCFRKEMAASELSAAMRTSTCIRPSSWHTSVWSMWKQAVEP